MLVVAAGSSVGVSIGQILESPKQKVVVLALTQKNLSFYGDRSCQYPEESIMKVAVDSFLGLHRRIQHLVDTSEVVGSAGIDP